MLRRRVPNLYNPATDGSITLWLDPSDSTKLLNTGGGAITNGATIGTFNTSGGTARAFTQFSTLGRPTWDSTGINGHGSCRSNNQILTTTTVTGFTSMSGLTVLMVARYNSGVGGSGFSFTMVDPVTTFAGISFVQVQSRDHFFVGGRRVGADGFQSITGNAISGSSPYIVGGVYDYANAKLSIFENGVRGTQNQTFEAAGTTSGAEPTYISVAGGFAQAGAGPVFSIGGPMDGWVGEILAWNTAKTPDQLVEPHTYLRLKWGIA